MKTTFIALLALCLCLGCGKKPDEAANVLFVEATKLISQAEAKEDADYKAAIADYEKALELIQKITDKYPETDLAVKLVSNETVFTGQTLAQIKARMDWLARTPERAEESRRAEERRRADEEKRRAEERRRAEEMRRAEEKRMARAKLLRWEFKTGGRVYSSPAIGSDGTVYVGSIDGKLYAINGKSKGLAKSPWPMRGQNARHTGRVMK